MEVTNKIKIHLDDLRLVPPIDVMQGDAYTRELEFSLYSGGEVWPVPEGVSVAVAYHGASGHGLYTTLQDDTTPSYTVSGNVVTVTLIPQVAAVAGNTTLTVLFTDSDGKQLATFGVAVRVAPNPAIGAGKPGYYYNLREWVGAAPLYVNLYASEDGTYTADKTVSEIQNADMAGRAVYCALETDQQERLTLPMVKATSDTCYFSVVCEGVEWLVIITGDGVTVMVDEHSTSEIVLTDRATGEVYTLYIENADLHITPGGSPVAAKNSIALADRAGGSKYVIYINNGDLVIAESEV